MIASWCAYNPPPYARARDYYIAHGMDMGHNYKSVLCYLLVVEWYSANSHTLGNYHMKRVTRNSLLAEKRQLQQQLAAAAGNTRKTLNARVHSAEQANKDLKAELKSVGSRLIETTERLNGEIAGLQARVKELEGEVKA